jgi:cytochrome c556
MLKVSGNLISTQLKKVLVTGAILFVSASFAHSDPVEVIKTRQQGLKEMGASLKTVRDQLRQGTPDMAAIKSSGENIKKTADLMATWFPKGTGTESGIKTGAKAEIWSDADTFEQKRKDFVAAANSFAEVTASGDKAAISSAVRPLSSTCKSCHEIFFNDEH